MFSESPGTPDGGILYSRVATTGPSSGYEVFGPGRQDVFTEPESCPQERLTSFVAPLALLLTIRAVS